VRGRELSESGLIVRAMERAQNLFPWPIRGAVDNDSAFMNSVVVPWSCTQKIEVTRSHAYKKNDQAFVEKNSVASMASRRHACWNDCMPHRVCTPTSSSRPSS
jgi:hypothetical protein